MKKKQTTRVCISVYISHIWLRCTNFTLMCIISMYPVRQRGWSYLVPGSSQQRSKAEYKPWKWGATAKYYTSHIKTMLPMRKFVPRSTWRPLDDRKETQTAVVWLCVPFNRSGQNHLARHNERGKKTRQTVKVGRQHQGMDRPGVRQVQEGSGEQGKMEKTGWKIICGAPTTLAVTELMMIMIRP